MIGVGTSMICIARVVSVGMCAADVCAAGVCAAGVSTTGNVRAVGVNIGPSMIHRCAAAVRNPAAVTAAARMRAHTTATTPGAAAASPAAASSPAREHRTGRSSQSQHN
jgi:hypothetical protein